LVLMMSDAEAGGAYALRLQTSIVTR